MNRQLPMGATLSLEERESWLRMDWNESAWAPDSHVIQEICDAADRVNEYAPYDQREITKLIMNRFDGIKMLDNIALFAGADNALLYALLAQKSWKEVGWTVPNYGYLDRLCEAARLVPTMRRDNRFSNDAHPLLLCAEQCGIVYVSNPMAQVGSMYSIGWLYNLCDSNPTTTFIIDETYADFVGLSMLDRQPLLKNVIIIRSFSKSYALAGIRLGYAVADFSIIERMRFLAGPEEISLLAFVAGRTALLHPERMICLMRYTQTGVQRLTEYLREQGFIVYESKANFVTFKCENEARAADLRIYLEDEHAILVRRLPGYPEHIRVTVRRADENRQFMKAVTSWLDKEKA